MIIIAAAILPAVSFCAGHAVVAMHRTRKLRADACARVDAAVALAHIAQLVLNNATMIHAATRAHYQAAVDLDRRAREARDQVLSVALGTRVEGEAPN